MITGRVMWASGRNERLHVRAVRSWTSGDRTAATVEGGVDPAKLVPILNYDGSPITARFITEEISRRTRGAITAVPQVAE